jgi:molybdopterin converting factor small subunit
VSVTVDVSPAICRTETGKRIRAVVEGNTVEECLRALSSSIDCLETAVFEDDGRLKRYVSVFVNGTSAYPDELAKAVEPGDRIHILVPTAGG